MAHKPPPFYGPAGARARLSYYREGRRHLRAALKRYPDLPPIEALLAAQSEGGPLASASVDRYKADHKFILSVLLRLERRVGDLGVVWPSLEKALDGRRARIPKELRRTSALKIVDATEEEARALFGELKRHALAHTRFFAILAALYVLVANHAGFRPIELLGARMEGNHLFLRTAKRRDGVPEMRGHDLSPLHADIRLGAALLLDLMPAEMTAAEFEDWHKALAAQMRRACKRIGIRPLSPYSFRHVAIATWAKAGLSPAEIAELAGHLSPRTHITHYARASVGHDRKALVKAVPQAAAELNPPAADPPAHSSSRLDTAAPVGAADNRDDPSIHNSAAFDHSDMPAPIYRTDLSRRALTSDEIAAARARIPDAGDPATIAANIRAAQARMLDKEQRREQGPAAHRRQSEDGK